MAEAPKEPKAEAKEQPAPDPAPESKTGFNLNGPVGTALAAIGGGLGVLGFVAFFGAAILWVRMDGAGLPGNDAVAVIAKSVLIVTGANFLVPAVLVALGFLALLYLLEWAVDRFGTRELRKLQGELSTQELEAEIKSAEAEIKGKALTSVRERADTMADLANDAAALGVQPGAEAAAAVPQVEDAYLAANEAQEESSAAETAVLKDKPKVAKRRIEGEAKIARWRRWLLIGLTIVLFAGGSAWMIIEYRVAPGRIVPVALAATFLTTVCVTVRLDYSLPWFSIVTFIAVGLMSCLLTFYRTVDHPKVEPAALLRTHGPPVFGFYVAQTSDRVYLGSRSGEGVGRLDAIPREEVTGLVVGDLESPPEAEEHAISFARQLCRQARERKATGKVAGSAGGGREGEEIASGCTAADRRWLARYARG
jgi:hypothetical protein